MGLTFDDGPDPRGTPAVLDALRAAGAKATFFVLSSLVTVHPDVARQVVADGHELGVHADVHERLDRLAIAELARRLAAAKATVEDATGAAVRFHRPPFGRLSWRGLQAATRAGMEVALWSHDPGDWRESTTAEGLRANLRASLEPGAIVLLHDGADGAVDMAASLSAELAASAGLEFVRLSDLV
ncbi:MAG: hypothetical protein QOF60_1702 [Actinomycetota bacterium]|nr:hypothetical protein [Actinomycetota bacterium]